MRRRAVKDAMESSDQDRESVVVKHNNNTGFRQLGRIRQVYTPEKMTMTIIIKHPFCFLHGNWWVSLQKIFDTPLYSGNVVTTHRSVYGDCSYQSYMSTIPQVYTSEKLAMTTIISSKHHFDVLGGNRWVLL